MSTFNQRSDDSEGSLDVCSRLLKDRIVLINTEINDELANTVVAQLLYLTDQDPTKDIYLYINSPGGAVTAGMAIYDTIQHIQADVVITCMGLAAGMSGFLLAAGTQGKRFSSPTARIMLCQPQGSSTPGIDIEVQAKEILYVKNKINELLAKHTGQPIAKIQTDTERDFWLTSSEALNYGIIDKIVDKK
jgi:ATP-dependent Clp protease, protease subunit